MVFWEREMKIWNIQTGPYEDEDGDPYCVCLVETDSGEMQEQEIYYDTMADAMKMVEYFKWHIEPLELETQHE
jgi:hypothetical protein